MRAHEIFLNDASRELYEEKSKSIISPTPENVEAAREFVMRKWIERAKEKHEEELKYYDFVSKRSSQPIEKPQIKLPEDLSNGCKFSSYFCSILFGGKMAGNYDHYFVILPDGEKFDLNRDAKDVRDMLVAHERGEGDDPYRRDDTFMRKSMKSDQRDVAKRVADWLTEFCKEQGIGAKFVKTSSGSIKRISEELISENARPRVFYRGTNPGDKRRIRTGDDSWDSYLFCADTEDGARWYGSQIEKIVAKPDAKIVYEGTRPFISLAKGLRLGRGNLNMLQWASIIASRAKDAGYDAVWFKHQTDIGTAIVNPAAFIRNSENLEESVVSRERDDRTLAARALMAKAKRFARSLKIRIHFKYPAFYAPEIEITDLYAETPGHGNGSKLMNFICSMADEAGFNLYVRPETPRNKEFYGRFGFEKSTRHFAMLVRYSAEPLDENIGRAWVPLR